MFPKEIQTSLWKNGHTFQMNKFLISKKMQRLRNIPIDSKVG